MILEHALRYAQLGWFVFPCHAPLAKGDLRCSCEVWRRKKSPDYRCSSPGKHPRTANGLDDATTDIDQIVEWWEHWPHANIGINCGKSGLLVVDLDIYKDTYQVPDLALNENTVTAITGGGGNHLFYRLEQNDCFGNTSKNLPVGIDIRGHGGYVIVAPSLHASGRCYAWELEYSPWEMAPAAIPPALRALLEARQERRQAVLFDTSPKFNGAGASVYGESALLAECQRVALAMQGQRNNTLNTAAFAVGQLIAGGELEHGYALGRLLQAAQQSGLAIAEAERTADSGLSAGMEHPRSSKLQDETIVDIDETMAIADCPDPAMLWIKPVATFDLGQYYPEDGGILDLWADLYGEHRLFTVGFDEWYTWGATHWEKDTNLGIVTEVENLILAMNKQARERWSSAAEKEEKQFWSRYISATQRSKSRIASVEAMARARCAIASSTLNQGNVLNLRNGVLNLDTLELRTHTADDCFTYCLPYAHDAAADCPRFKQFIREVFVKEDTLETDEELAQLYQEALGYALTTDTEHEAMFWFSGEGGNGKTVAITVLQKLLGPLCFSVSFEEMGKSNNYDLADVAGKRVIFSTESERGGKLAEGHIKRIVSGERINARPIYGSPFEFQSTAKIFWAMNDLPVIRDTSNGVWRRLMLIPFLRVFREDEKDTKLIGKLEAELSGILNFALEGLRRLRQQGRFTESSAVRAAVEEYRHESNPVGQWLEERTQPTYTPGHPPVAYPTTAKTLFEDYRGWAENNGRQIMNSTNFGRELRRLRVPRQHTMRGNTYAVNLI